MDRTRVPGVDGRSGFSLIELLIVVAIIASLVGPAILRTDRLSEEAKVSCLRNNLKVIRQAIDDFRGDRRRFPGSLAELVEKRYLREVPRDPTTLAAETWVAVPSAPGRADLADVRSSTEEYRWY
jgi:general secretion pathway protein G